MEVTGTENLNAKATKQKAPSVFSYLDYRAYLKDFYDFKKLSNPNFSLAVFSQKAGLVTRNYLKRVIDGERPLSSELIPKFCAGLGLTPKEKVYFEALIHFNQTKDADSKKHYFSSLQHAASGIKGGAVEIVRDQFDVYNHWYNLPVREMVLLKDFEENPNYIVKKLKNKITKKQAQESLELLARTGLLIRDQATGKLKQATPVMVYDKDVVNMVIREFHKQTLERTKEAIQEDAFNSWDLRSLSLAIPSSEMPKIQNELKEFIHSLNLKYSNQSDEAKKAADAVILLNAQIITVTKNSEEK